MTTMSDTVDAVKLTLDDRIALGLAFKARRTQLLDSWMLMWRARNMSDMVFFGMTIMRCNDSQVKVEKIIDTLHTYTEEDE